MNDDAVLVMWTLYDHPHDIPDSFVARKWLVTRQGERPTGEIVRADTAQAIYEHFRNQGLGWIERHPDDDPKIMGTFL